MKLLKHPATIIATVALFVAFGGGAAAYASGLINGAQIKNHSIAAKKLTKSAIKSLRGKRGPAGPPGTPGAAGTPGAPGSALAYAHINPNGTFDAANSKNVTASNMTEPGTGFYCFNGLSFTPKNVVVTLDYNGVLNGQIPEDSVELPATAGTCGTAKQVAIFTGLVNPGVFTSGANLGFYVLFN